MPRTGIKNEQICDGTIIREDFSDPVRYRVEGVQYPIDQEVIVENEAILFRCKTLKITSTGIVKIEAGGKVCIQ